MMTFDDWLKTLDSATRQELDDWSARVGWEAAVYHLRPDLEALDLLRKMQPLPEEESK